MKKLFKIFYKILLETMQYLFACVFGLVLGTVVGKVIIFTIKSLKLEKEFYGFVESIINISF